MLNINSVKNNLVKNYFRKFSLRQKIIGILTILVALVISSFFIFFYESEENKLRIALEERLINFMYEDFEFPEMLKKDLVKYDGSLEDYLKGKAKAIPIHKSKYDVDDYSRDIYDTITRNKSIKINISKTHNEKYECIAELSSYRKGEAGILFFDMTVRFELIGNSEQFSADITKVIRNIYRINPDGSKTNMGDYKNMGHASRDCWRVVEYEK